MPTVRQEDGIALSSRNDNLSKKQLQEYIQFHKNTLHFISELDNDMKISDANNLAIKFIDNQKLEKYDYFEFRNSINLSSDGNISGSRLFYAIFKGNIRLIDNLII